MIIIYADNRMKREFCSTTVIIGFLFSLLFSGPGCTPDDVTEGIVPGTSGTIGPVVGGSEIGMPMSEGASVGSSHSATGLNCTD